MYDDGDGVIGQGPSGGGQVKGVDIELFLVPAEGPGYDDHPGAVGSQVAEAFGFWLIVRDDMGVGEGGLKNFYLGVDDGFERFVDTYVNSTVCGGFLGLFPLGGATSQQSQKYRSDQNAFTFHLLIFVSLLVAVLPGFINAPESDYLK